MVVGLWVQAVLGSLPCASLPLPSACRAWIQPQRRGLLPRREFPCLPWPVLGLLLAADARRLAGLLPPPCACYPLSARVPSSAARSSYGAHPYFFPSVPLLPAEALVFSLARSELPCGRAWFSVSSTKCGWSSPCSVPAPASALVRRPTIVAPPAPRLSARVTPNLQLAELSLGLPWSSFSTRQRPSSLPTLLAQIRNSLVQVGLFVRWGAVLSYSPWSAPAP